MTTTDTDTQRRALTDGELATIHAKIDAGGTDLVARHAEGILAVYHAFGYDPIPENFSPSSVAIPDEQWKALSQYCNDGGQGSGDLRFETMMLWVNVGPSSFSAVM